MVNVISVPVSLSIIVSWREVPCQNRNGEITRYVVEYNEQQERSQRVMIMMDAGQTTTLHNLKPLTEYSIMVAAVNSNGTGQFSQQVTIVTKGTHAHVVTMNHKE